MSELSFPLRLGTRKSLLAKTQSQFVAELLKSVGVPTVLVEVESSGDLDKKTPLYEIDALGTPGLFTKELEAELLGNRIDLAVHSLKDLPTTQPEGLVIVAIPQRESTADVLVVRKEAYDPSRPWRLRAGSRIGTSSLRREAQIISEMPEVEVVSLRGNVPGRIQKVREGKVDAAVLAQAGLNRLKLELSEFVLVPLPSDVFIPAPGQGALALECSKRLATALSQQFSLLNHGPTEKETRIERAVLKGLHGGCSLPLGVKCEASSDGKSLKLKAFLGVLRPHELGHPKAWGAFHRFEITHENEETLIDNTIAHFKDVMNANPRNR